VLGDESIGTIQPEIQESDLKINEESPRNCWNNFKTMWLIILLDETEGGIMKQERN
jgi:hypothetical protein